MLVTTPAPNEARRRQESQEHMEREHPRHVGDATLRLLIEDWSLPILRALMVGPRRPSELEDRLPDIPHSALIRRLGELDKAHLADREHAAGLNPVSRYTLTRAGRMILAVASAAERWEHRWSEIPNDGIDALRLIADEHTREILLALAPAPATPSTLERSVALTRSPLRRRLGELNGHGMLQRTGGSNRASYRLTDSARDLVLVSMSAARWEWEWNPPGHSPRAVNVARALHIVGPRAEMSADVDGGVCSLHVDDGARGPTVQLAVGGRRVTALEAPSTEQPMASCHGSPRAWCHGLLLRDWDGVLSDGNRDIMAAILLSLTVAVVA
ncbi:MAG: winged helix-turn-helix transcriptional regulator [Solirubrobacteraceae bacterium]